MVDRISEEQRSWNMSRIRGADTRPELQLRSLLHGAGYRFRLHDPKLPGRPDMISQEIPCSYICTRLLLAQASQLPEYNYSRYANGVLAGQV